MSAEQRYSTDSVQGAVSDVLSHPGVRRGIEAVTAVLVALEGVRLLHEGQLAYAQKLQENNGQPLSASQMRDVIGEVLTNHVKILQGKFGLASSPNLPKDNITELPRTGPIAPPKTSLTLVETNSDGNPVVTVGRRFLHTLGEIPKAMDRLDEQLDEKVKRFRQRTRDRMRRVRQVFTHPATN